MTDNSGRPWQNWDIGDAAETIDLFWTRSEQEKAIRRLQARRVKQLMDQPGSIFEVGCGTGLMAEALIEAGVVTSEQYSGGDVSVAMLDIARKRYPNLALSELDIFSLTSIDQEENVVCFHVLQHLPSYANALQQLLDFTRKQLFIATWFTEDEDDIIREGRDSDAAPSFYLNRYSMHGFLSSILSYRRKATRVYFWPLQPPAYGLYISF